MKRKRIEFGIVSELLPPVSRHSPSAIGFPFVSLAVYTWAGIRRVFAAGIVLKFITHLMHKTPESRLCKYEVNHAAVQEV